MEMESPYETLYLNGIYTEILSYKANKPSNLSFVLIPGNPGVSFFYRDLCIRLHKLLDSLNIYAVSYAGHTIYKAVEQIYNLEDQINHKINYLDFLRSTNKNMKFILFGHSIGSYICLQIMKRRPDLPIIYCINAFPFIRYDVTLFETCSFMMFFYSRYIISFLLMLFNYLPLFTKLKIIGLFSGIYDIKLQNIILKLTNYYTFRNLVSLGYDEFYSVKSTFPSFIFESRFLKNVLYLWCRKDRWSPINQLKEMSLKGAHIYHMENITHEFCAHLKESDAVTDICADSITSFLDTGKIAKDDSTMIKSKSNL